MTRTFESSAAGALNTDAVLECGVCWWQYDPAKGDDVWDIPPGTAFADLPDHWRCPSCDAPASKFMLVDSGAAEQVAPVADQASRVASLLKAYEAAEEQMLGLPVHNPALRIEATDFHPFEDGYAGIIITPWCMNIVLLPADARAKPHGPLGSSRDAVFPSGGYPVIAGHMDGVGAVETCSLFSPMDEFDDPDVARATADAALDGLFEAPETQAPDGPALSRRGLFTGARAAE